MRIRKVKNSSGNISVQVGYYQGKTFNLVKHIGSARNAKQLETLIHQAEEYINKDNLSLFNNHILNIKDSDLIPIGYTRMYAYKFFSEAFTKVFPSKTYPIFRDLTILRIIHPTSKKESLELLQEYFGIKYSYATMYRDLLKLNKEDLISNLVNYAHEHLSFDFSLLFYDVTTLYFESQPDENLKRPGFSKDGKHTQPQILIGLVVDSNGFPIYYEIFKGNSFEGHTMLPVILNFKKNFNVKNLTIVADSAMLSETNLSLLESEKLNYIVGNRTITTYNNRLKSKIIDIKNSDGSTFEIREGERTIIYHYSSKRERKDLYELGKSVKKAEYLAQNPSKRSRAKYLKVTAEKATINDDLVEKHTLLAGIKSYKTNLSLPAKVVIERYGDLWKIEKAFRMSKHDLKARPIFHRQEEAIKSHIQIVFAANAVAKHIELTTSKSIQKIVKDKMREIQVQFKMKDSNEIFSFSVSPH